MRYISIRYWMQEPITFNFYSISIVFAMTYYAYDPRSHFRRASRFSVSLSSLVLSLLNSSAASRRAGSTAISLVTTHSPFSLRNVCLRSFSVGSPCGNTIASIATRCLIVHKRALFSGIFLTIATSVPAWKAHKSNIIARYWSQHAHLRYKSNQNLSKYASPRMEALSFRRFVERGMLLGDSALLDLPARTYLCRNVKNGFFIFCT